MSKKILFLWYIILVFHCLTVTVSAELTADNLAYGTHMDVIYPPEDFMETREPDPTVFIKPDESKKLIIGDIFPLGFYEQNDNADDGPEPINWQILSVKRGKPVELICTFVPEEIKNAEPATDANHQIDLFIQKAFRDDEQRLCILDKGLLDKDQFKRYENRFEQYDISTEDWNLRPVILVDMEKFHQLQMTEKIEALTPTVTMTPVPDPTPIPPSPIIKKSWILLFVFVLLLIAVGLGVSLISKNQKRKKNVKHKKDLFDLDQTINLPKPEEDRPVNSKIDTDSKKFVYACSGCKGQGKRDYQEDSLWYKSFSSPEGVMCGVIADGMGGMDNGAESSKIAISVFESCASQIHPGKDIPSQLYDICKTANKAIYETNSTKDMNGGATLVCVFVINNLLYWISIGDSRIFLYRDGMLASVNEEHELENRMYNGLMCGDVDLNDIREMKEHELRKLTSNLGRSSIPMVDQNFISYQLQKGDKILLCSDGVSGTLNENEISDCLKDPNPDVNCDKIVEMIELKDKKRQDNFSAVVITVVSGE